MNALEIEAENIIDPITASLADAVQLLCVHTSMHVEAYACVCVDHVYVGAHVGQSSTLKEPSFLFL